MQITWNQQVVKKENKTLVLDLIMNSFPISRADAAQKLGLNKGTVSSLVSELIDEKLIFESGPGESSGGRRPVMLLFNQNAGYSIGVDLGVNYIYGVLTDLLGNIILEKNTENPGLSYKDALREVTSLIQELIDSAPSSPYGIIGIGVGAPGIVNKEGDVLLAPNLGWRNVSLKRDLEHAFNLPVIVENEANAGAYGEKKFGVGKDYDNLIYISAGIGIGAGIIINGELYKGINGYSGEVGHMSIDFNGPKCSCGNNGCWELYASEQSLISKAGSFGLENEMTLEKIINLAASEDEDALSMLKETGRHLGLGIINIINAFNPKQIIIGNRLAAAKEWLSWDVKQTINKYTLPFHQTEIDISFSNLALPAAALGVSAFSIENFIKNQLQI
ncbi:ROK family protein [Mesobacillus foraminis]|uniref:ROK family transcriptional regulator n=1 Tax=Mesobacillus foraminis TaxID=279826 RepID=UPI0039A09C0B